MLRRLRNFLAAAIIAATPAITVLVPSVVHAAADTCVWTGAGDGTTFGDGSNWSGCDNSTTPQAGDTLEFGTSATATWNLTDDLGLAYAGVNVVADGTGTGTIYNIDTLTFATGATIDQTQGDNGSDFVNVNTDNITAQGTLTLNGNSGRFDFGNATTVTLNGLLTLTGGATFYGDLVGSSGVVVEKDSKLYFTATSTTPNTSTYPITLGGGSGTAKPIIQFDSYFSGSLQDTTWTFANPITLASDALIYLGDAQVTVNQSGAISGTGNAVALDPTSVAGGTLVLGASSNSSATVLGTFVATGSGNGLGGSGSVPVTAPAAPDTGFALVSAHPGVTLAITLAATAGILGVARMTRKSVSRR